MPDQPDDYWPTNLVPSSFVTPASLMREQAALLGSKTNQQITAAVVAVGTPGAFTWSFQLFSAALGNYRYELFRVSHDLKIYPAVFNWENHADQVVANEAQFKAYLKDIIGSEQTKQIVQGMLSQIIK